MKSIKMEKLLMLITKHRIMHIYCGVCTSSQIILF